MAEYDIVSRLDIIIQQNQRIIQELTITNMRKTKEETKQKTKKPESKEKTEENEEEEELFEPEEIKPTKKPQKQRMNT